MKRIGMLTSGGDCQALNAAMRGISEDRFTFDTDVNKWLNSGVYKVDIKNDIFQVTDLPYDTGFDKFEKHLQLWLKTVFLLCAKLFYSIK